MKAEILCVGTEILLGDIVNTNAAFLARELAAMGILVYHQSVVGDNPGRLEAQLRRALEENDCVIMTGGLGPTYDDLTKETAAGLFGRKMAMHEESLRQIEAFFARRKRPMTENNKKQAMMPEGAIIFPNHNGTYRTWKNPMHQNRLSQYILSLSPPQQYVRQIQSLLIFS